MSTVEGAFDVTVADVARARTWLLLRHRFVIVTAILALAALGWVVVMDLRRGSGLDDAIPYAGLLLFWFGFIPLSTWWGARRYVRQLPAGQAHQRLRLSDEGVEQEDAQASGRASWDTFLSAHETNQAFYLRMVGPLVRLVPKRAFAGEAEVAAVRRLLRERMGPRAHVKGD